MTPQSCSGIEVIIKDINQFSPLSTATSIMLLIERLHPREFQWEKDDYLNKLFGTNDLRVIAAPEKKTLIIFLHYGLKMYMSLMISSNHF